MKKEEVLKTLLERLSRMDRLIGEMLDTKTRVQCLTSKISDLERHQAERCEQRRAVIQARLETETRRIEDLFRGEVKDVHADLDDTERETGKTVNGKITNINTRVDRLADAVGFLRSDLQGAISSVNNIGRSLSRHLSEEKKEKRASVSTQIAIVTVIVAGLSAFLNLLGFLR